MDLWIRSQDKLNLTIAHSIDIEPYGVDRNEWKVSVNALHFGVYKSYERAMEVLDGIQKLLVPQIFELVRKIQNKDLSPTGIYNVYAIEDTRTGQVDIREIQTLYYQMPKE